MIKLTLWLSLITLFSCAQVKTTSLQLDKPSIEKDFFKVAWVKNLDPIYNTGNLPIGTSSPYAFEDILYMGNLKGYMQAYSVETGEVLWSANEKLPIQSQVNKLGDYVFYGTKTGRLITRHYLTGKLNYSIDLGSPIETQPSFLQGRVVLHLRNHTVITLDAKTGKIFWRYKRSIPYVTTLQRVSQLLPYKNSMIIGFADGYLVSLSLEEGVINWEQKLSVGIKFVDVDVQPVMFNGMIVAGSASGPLRFLSPESGAIEKTIDFHQSHTPLIVDGEMIVGSVFGLIYHIDKFGKVVRKLKVSDDGISSISQWKGHFVVTTMGKFVYQIDMKTLNTVSSFDLGSDQSAVFGTSVKADSFLALYSSRNRLYIFK